VLRTLQKLNRHSRHTPVSLFCQATALFCFEVHLEAIPFSFSPSAEQLRAKSGKNDGGPERGKGIAIVAEAQGMSERSRATFCSPWFCLICRVKAMCGKEAFLLTSLFGYFCGYKNN
jgi:hypothetical protein